MIRQTVADYAKWRPLYDAHQPARDAAGLTNCHVRSTTGNPNEVFVACEMTDLAKAQAFTKSKSLADAMKNAGVVGKPDFYFLGPERASSRRGHVRAGRRYRPADSPAIAGHSHGCANLSPRRAF